METSLADAAPDGDMERVNYLINKVRYEKGQCGYFGDALLAVVLIRHKEIVEILIKAGADVNAQSRYFGNALQVAIGCQQI